MTGEKYSWFWIGCRRWVFAFAAGILYAALIFKDTRNVGISVIEPTMIALYVAFFIMAWSLGLPKED